MRLDLKGKWIRLDMLILWIKLRGFAGVKGWLMGGVLAFVIEDDMAENCKKSRLLL
jgi:hypothetical protein